MFQIFSFPFSSFPLSLPCFFLFFIPSFSFLFLSLLLTFALLFFPLFLFPLSPLFISSSLLSLFFSFYFLFSLFFFLSFFCFLSPFFFPFFYFSFLLFFSSFCPSSLFPIFPNIFSRVSDPPTRCLRYGCPLPLHLSLRLEGA